MSEVLYREAFKWRGKINKKDAEREVLELFKAHPDAREGLSKLLSFFADKTPKAKTIEGWVALAAAKKDIRRYLSYVCATGTEIVATDGARLHLAPSSLPRGLYDPVSFVKVFDLYEDCDGGKAEGHPGKFPDYQRIIPRRDTHPLADAFLEAPPVRRGKMGMVIDVITPGFSQTFFENQWRAIADRCTHCALEGPGHSALFEGPDGIKGVVMPLREPAAK